jgi:hypothetical protein
MNTKHHGLAWMTHAELLQIKRTGEDTALCRLALAFSRGTGVTLSAREVADIIMLDDALHTRLGNVLSEKYDKK